MGNTSVTYYFGQIKPEYRGNDALFLSFTKEGWPSFITFPLGSESFMEYSNQISGENFPIRSYLGVNGKAQSELMKRLETDLEGDLALLDVGIVRNEVARFIGKEIFDLERACMKAASEVWTAKAPTSP